MKKKKRAAPTRLRRNLMTVAVALCFAGEPAYANPTSPTVVNGQVLFNGLPTFNVAGKTLTINNSPGAIINWQGFSIPAGEITKFIQQSASSSVLNRVIAGNPSVILGTLQSQLANGVTGGRVYLINPSGITFGAGSQIDTGGLVASTLNLSDVDFLAGRNRFTALPGAGGIVNEGTITTPAGGSIYLVAPSITNSGIIRSDSGEVVLAAGNSVELVDSNSPNLSVQITAPDNQAVNLGQIIAQGGRIGIYGGLIRQGGVVNANSAVMGANGKIVFKATKDVTLDAGSTTTANGSQGGSITVQSDTGTTSVSGTIEAKGSDSTGGTIQVLGNQVGLFDNVTVNASGQTGGGTVLVGGDYHGSNPLIQNASQTYVGANATINADAIRSGDGGKVIVWGNDTTQFYGSITARGGSNSGNGGFVETSGSWLDATGTVNTLSSNGSAGTWLLDPTNIIVAAGGVAYAAGTNNLFASPGTTTTIAPTLINTSASNVVLQASTDISFNSPVSITTAGVGLIAQAGRNINVGSTNNHTATITTTGGKIILEADSPSSTSGANGTGQVNIQSAVTSNGGAITLIAGGNPIQNGGGFVLNALVDAGAGGINVALTGNSPLGIGSIGQITQILGNPISRPGDGSIANLHTTGPLVLGTATTAGTDGLGTGSQILTANAISNVVANSAIALSTASGASVSLVAGTGGITIDQPLTSFQSVTINTTGVFRLAAPLNTNNNTLTILNATSVNTTGGSITTGSANIVCGGATTGCPAGSIGGSNIDIWNVNSSGNFLTASNWSLNRVPGAGDVAVIGAGASPFTVSLGSSSQSAALLQSVGLLVNNETLNVVGSATVPANSTTLNISKDITHNGSSASLNTGTINLTNAVLGGTGLLNNQGTLNVTNSTVSASINQTAGTSLPPPILNASGTNLISGGLTIAAGAFNVISGNTVVSGATGQGNYSGSVNIASGTELDFTGGTQNISGSSAIVSGTGTIGVAGATVNIDALATYSVGTTTISSGAINFDNAVTLSTLNVNGGAVGGIGSLTVSNFNQTGGAFGTSDCVTGCFVDVNLTHGGTFNIGAFGTISGGLAASNSITLNATGASGDITSITGGITAGSVHLAAGRNVTLGSVVSASSGNVTIDVGQATGGTFSTTVAISSTVGTVNINGGTGGDIFDFSGAPTFAATVAGGGGSGVDTLIGSNATNIWNINAPNAGNVSDGTNTIAFSGIANLTGGSNTDTFNVTNNGTSALGSISGTIAGGLGSNALNLSGVTTAVAVNINGVGAGSVSGGTTVGSFTGIGTLTGTAANDTFTLATTVPSFGGSIVGGGGTDTLASTDTANTWVVNAANGGTLNATTTFSGIANLTGGSNTDTFNVTNNGTSALGSISGTIAGGLGSNALNLSGVTTAVAVNINGVGAGSVSGGTTVGSFTGIGTLTGTAANDTFTLATTVPSFGGSIVGGGGTDTLASTDTANTWVVNAANGGTLNATTTFSGIANLTGGSNTDTFNVTNNGTSALGSISGTIAGGLGSNALNLSGVTTAVAVNINGVGAGSVSGGTTVGSFTGIGTLTGTAANDTFTLATTVPSFGGSIVGGGGTDTLASTDTANTWVVNAANGGTLNATTTFSGIANLTGGSNTDTFNVTNNGTSALGSISGTIAGGLGSNALNLSGVTTAVAVNINGVGAGSVSGGTTVGSFTGIGTLTGTAANDTFTLATTVPSFGGSIVGGGGTDTLASTDTANTWVVNAANGGTLNATTTFSGIANLTGGSNTDTFNVTNNGTSALGSISGTIAGGLGSNALNLSGVTTAVAVNINGVGAGSVSGGTTVGSFTGIGTLTGTAANDTFTLATTVPSFGGSIVGGGGTDTLASTDTANTWVVNAANGGTLNATTTFSGIANLTGGSNTDTFNVTNNGTSALGSISGTIAGGLGSNALNLSGVTTAVAVNINGVGAGSVSGGTTVGSFTGIGTLTGTAANDTFTLATTVPSFGGSIVGGGGTDTLASTDTANTWVVNAANGGTLNATTTFSGIANLTGGSNTDTFNVTNNGTSALGSISGTIAGGLGSNALNLSGVTTAVAVNINGVGAGSVSGGTTVGSFTGIGTLTGTAANDTFTLATTVPSFGGSIVGGGGTDTLASTDTANTWVVNAANGGTLNATTTFSGIANLTGGSNTDTLTGSNQTYNLTGANTGNNGSLFWTSIENLTATGASTIAGGLGSSLSGNLSSATTALSGTITTGGTQTYTGAVTVGGAVTLNAGASAITATNLANSFGGTVTASGNTIQITNAGALTVVLNDAGTSTIDAGGALAVSGNVAGTLNTATSGGAAGTTSFGTTSAGVLSAVSSGVISQTGALTVASAATFDTQANNTIGNVTITTQSPIAVGPSQIAGNFTLNAGTNTVSFAPNVDVAGNMTVTTTGVVNAGANVRAAGTNNALNDASTITATGATPFVLTQSLLNGMTGPAVTVTLASPTYTANAPLTASAINLGLANSFGGPLRIATTSAGIVAGATSNHDLIQTSALNFGGKNVTIVAQPGTIFGGPNTLNGGNGSLVTLTQANTNLGSIGFSNTFNSAITTAAGNPVTLAPSLINGSLSVVSGGAVSQTGALTVAGTTSINAGVNPIALLSLGNNFIGPMTLIGGATSIGDANTLDLAGANISSGLFTAASTININGNVTATAGDLVLDAGNSIAVNNSQVRASGAVSINSVNSAGPFPTLDITGASAPALLQAGTKLGIFASNVTLTGGAGSATITGGPGQFGIFSSGNITLNGGTAGALIFGNPDVNLTVGGNIFMNNGVIQSASPNSITIIFPNLSSGGIVGTGSLIAGTAPAILDTNLHLFYGSGAPVIVTSTAGTTQIAITIPPSSTSPGGTITQTITSIDSPPSTDFSFAFTALNSLLCPNCQPPQLSSLPSGNNLNSLVPNLGNINTGNFGGLASSGILFDASTGQTILMTSVTSIDSGAYTNVETGQTILVSDTDSAPPGVYVNQSTGKILVVEKDEKSGTKTASTGDAPKSKAPLRLKKLPGCT